MRKMWMSTVLGLAAVAAAGAGCSMFKSVSGTAALLMSGAEIKEYVGRSKDPRMYSITIYEPEKGVPVIVNGNRTRAGQRAIAPFVSPPGSAFPLVRARAGATELQAITDTSAPESWTAMDRRVELGLVPLGPPTQVVQPAHVADPVDGYLSVIPSFSIDQLDVEAAIFYARASRGPLWPLSRTAVAEKAAAVCGFDFLRGFAAVQWDFSGRVLLLSSSTAYEPDPGRLIASLPFDPTNGVLIVRGEVGGKPGQVLLDTAGEFEVAMDNPPQSLLRQIAVGDIVFRQVQVVPTRQLGLGRPDLTRVGLRLLSRYRVTMDNRRNLVYFEKPLEAGVVP